MQFLSLIIKNTLFVKAIINELVNLYVFLTWKIKSWQLTIGIFFKNFKSCFHYSGVKEMGCRIRT